MLLAPGKFPRVAVGETIRELVELSLLLAIFRPNLVILARKPLEAEGERSTEHWVRGSLRGSWWRLQGLPKTPGCCMRPGKGRKRFEV